MLRVGAAFDGQVRSFAHFLAQLQFESGKIGNGAVMHETVSSEDEWMVIDRGDWRAARCPDVSHQHSGFRVGADGVVVEIIRWWLYAFVHGRPEALFLGAIARLACVAFLEVGVGGCIPDNAYSVDVVYHVAGGD